jgi:hypothetical protein
MPWHHGHPDIDDVGGVTTRVPYSIRYEVVQNLLEAQRIRAHPYIDDGAVKRRM